MVLSTSISEGVTFCDDKGLHWHLTDGARDVWRGDASIGCFRATMTGWTFSEPMPPAPLHRNVAQVEHHSHPY